MRAALVETLQPYSLGAAPKGWEGKLVAQPIARSRVKVFQLDQAEMRVDHWPLSRVAFTIHEDGRWTLSLRATPNAGNVPPTLELQILDPNADPVGNPTAVPRQVAPGRAQIDIPTTVIVHRFYYTGDRTFQGPFLKGGSCTLVLHLPENRGHRDEDFRNITFQPARAGRFGR